MDECREAFHEWFEQHKSDYIMYGPISFGFQAWKAAWEHPNKHTAKQIVQEPKIEKCTFCNKPMDKGECSVTGSGKHHVSTEQFIKAISTQNPSHMPACDNCGFEHPYHRDTCVRKLY